MRATSAGWSQATRQAPAWPARARCDRQAKRARTQLRVELEHHLVGGHAGPVTLSPSAPLASLAFTPRLRAPSADRLCEQWQLTPSCPLPRRQICRRLHLSLSRRPRVMKPVSRNQKERERGREVLHLSSHTGLMQVLPGHPLAGPKRECYTRHGWRFGEGGLKSASAAPTAPCGAVLAVSQPPSGRTLRLRRNVSG